MKRENRTLANRIKKVDQPQKNSIFLDGMEKIDKESFLKDIVRDIPCGQYHLNSGEVNSINDMLWNQYGYLVANQIDHTFFIGLSAYCDSGRKVNGKIYNASFTHDLNIITITT